MPEQKTLNDHDVTITRAPLLSEKFITIDSDPTDDYGIELDVDPDDPVV